MGEQLANFLADVLGLVKKEQDPKCSQQKFGSEYLGLEITPQQKVWQYLNKQSEPDFDAFFMMLEKIGIDLHGMVKERLLDDRESDPAELAENLNMARKVLTSGTPDALSLHMNIHSFHDAVVAKEEAAKREESFKKELQENIDKQLAGFMKKMEDLIRKPSEASTLPRLKPDTEQREK